MTQSGEGWRTLDQIYSVEPLEQPSPPRGEGASATFALVYVPRIFG